MSTTRRSFFVGPPTFHLTLDGDNSEELPPGVLGLAVYRDETCDVSLAHNGECDCDSVVGASLVFRGLAYRVKRS